LELLPNLKSEVMKEIDDIMETKPVLPEY
jgi:hypothetical protein